MTKFFSMNDKVSTNNTEKCEGLFQRTRNKFAVLQEIGFERNENSLRELLKDERDLVQFPIPLFLPAFLVWLFMLLFLLLRTQVSLEMSQQQQHNNKEGESNLSLSL